MQNVAIKYDYYTLDQARAIIKAEEAEKKATRSYFIKQKMLGLFALSVSACEIFAGYAGMIDEGGICLFMIPLGLYTLFTKKEYVTFKFNVI